MSEETVNNLLCSDEYPPFIDQAEELPLRLVGIRSERKLLHLTFTQMHFLVNPAASRGKGRRRWSKLLPRLQAALPEMTWAESTATTGMPALAAAAVRAGHTRLIGVGGDGTHHDILNGIIAAGGLGKVTYAPLPAGTGNDWVRTLGTPRKLAKWLAMLRAGRTIEHRVGVLSIEGETQKSAERAEKRRQDDATQRVSALSASLSDSKNYFLNVAGLAYDAEVVRRSEQLRYKHRFLYPFLTLAFLRDFTAPTVRIEYGEELFTVPVHTVNFGIGRYSGGGMRLVPHAEPTVDTLALTFARRLPIWKILAESWRFYTGTIGAVKEVTLAHATEVKVTPVKGKLEIEADGEWLGTGRVVVTLLDQYLRVVV